MELLGVIGVLALWGTIGHVPWLTTVLATRGRAPLIGLPLAIAAGIGGGALVPALGAKDFLGVWISLAAAFVAGGAVSIGSARMLATDAHR
jgi:hypothetical protein